jgi:uncharacterized protein DUF4159
MTSRLAAAVAIASIAAATVAAQELWRGGQDPFQRGFGRFRREPPKYATRESFDGGFNFCRLMYESDRREEGGQGWTTDYPGADINLSIRLSELTKITVSRARNGEPNHVVVPIMDPLLFKCPFLMIEDVGTVRFSDQEVRQLRAYFDKGGFMWADDFWGTWAWEQWEEEIGRVLPPGEFPIVEIPMDHPMFRTLYTVTTVPQVANIGFWRRSGGGTSERGSDSAHPNVRGISDRDGRLMVLMTHNTDIADTWEREGENQDYFFLFSPEGYAVAVNVLIYSMTH